MTMIEQLHSILKQEVKARKIYGAYRFSGNRISVARRDSAQPITITVGSRFLMDDDLTCDIAWVDTLEEAHAWVMERVDG